MPHARGCTSSPGRRRGSAAGSAPAPPLELGFTFDTLALEAHGALMGPGAPLGLADEMHAARVRFVRDGDPGWASYDLDRRPVQDFGQQVRLVEDPRGRQRAVWNGIR